MPSVVDDDLDTIIDLPGSAHKPLTKAKLDQLGNELRFVLLTSAATVEAFDADAGNATELDGLRVAVVASEEEKCERCWHHSETVGTNAQHPTLCQRCVDNVEGEGEVRLYA